MWMSLAWAPQLIAMLYDPHGAVVAPLLDHDGGAGSARASGSLEAGAAPLRLRLRAAAQGAGDRLRVARRGHGWKFELRERVNFFTDAVRMTWDSIVTVTT